MATSVAKIQAELDLDTGRFTGSVTSAIGSVRKFNTSVGEADKSLKNIEHRVTGLGSSLRDSMVILGQFRGAMHTLWMFTGQWAGAIVDANAKLERLQILMKGLSKSTTEVGKLTDSLRDMNYVLDKSKTTPFAIDTIADAFVKLKASGIDPTKGALDALTDATARFGGNSETLHRATIAIQQMAGKGVISMEELRQQLGEAVPNAMQLVAQATGLSMAQLVKTISSGRLQASGALNKLFLEMRIQFAGASENMMDTWVGLVQKLKTEWLLFAKEIGSAGLFESAKQSLRELIAFMGSSKGKDLAHDIGRSIAEAAKMAAELIHWLVDNRDEIVTWGKLLAEIFVIKRLTDFTFGLIKSGVEVVKWTRTLGGLTTAMAAARAGTLSWSAAIGAAAGPIGIAITAIGGLIMWLNNQYDAAKRAGQAMQEYYDATARGEVVSPEQHKAMQERVEYFNRVNDFLKRAKATGSGHGPNIDANIALDKTATKLMEEGRKFGVLQDAGNGVDDFFTSLSTKMNKLATIQTREIVELNEKVGRQAVLQARERAKNITSEFAKGQEKAGEAIMAATATKLNEIQAKLDSGALKPAQAASQRQDVLTTAINDRVSRLKAAKVNLEQQLSTTIDPAAINAAKNNMAEVDRLLQAAYADRSTVTDPLVLLPKMGGGKDGAKAKANPLAEYLQTVIGKVAELKAKVDDGNPTLAKFQAMLAAGAYGKNPDGSIVARITAQLKELAVEQDKKKIKALTDDIKEMEAQSASDLMLSKLDSTNKMYAEVSVNVVTFSRKIAGMREEWIKANGSVDGFNDSIKQTQQNMADMDFESLTRYVTDAKWNAYLDSLPKRARDFEEFTHQMEMNADMIDRMAEANPGRAGEIQALGAEHAAAIAQAYKNVTKPAWQKMLDDWNDTTTAMDSMWGNAMGSMANTLTDFITSGKANWRELATGILKEITRILMAKALAKLVEIITMMAGGGGEQWYAKGGVPSLGAGGDERPFAKGGAFGAGIHRFAKGNPFANKVVDRTTMAPMAMFGEAGPEAIMPLSRDATGTLGVKMHGQTGSGVQNNVSIVVNIASDGSSSSTTDADKQSQGKQLGSMIETKVTEVISRQMRPGGILWKGK